MLTSPVDMLQVLLDLKEHETFENNLKNEVAPKVSVPRQIARVAA